MGTKRDLTRLLLSALAAGAILGLAACESSDPGDRPCTAVDVEHLARPFHVAGLTMVCNPQQVSAPYRERYFPGYKWGDETWTVKQQ